MRRVYSAYPGTGSVYSMVARFSNYSAAYVPIVSYGCDPVSGQTSCDVLSKIHFQFYQFFACLFITI